MKRILIHSEYLCIMNVIALPFLVMFYGKQNLIFWLLLLVLDAATLILLDHMKQIWDMLIDKKYTAETQRIKIYLFTILCLNVYAILFKSIIISIIYILNTILALYLCHMYDDVKKKHNKK